MDLVNTLLGALGLNKNATGAEGGANPLEAILGLIQNSEGGLQGLVQKFTDAGLGEQISSWISTGANMPISADQIRSVISESGFGDLAAKLGISSEQVASSLADMLPKVIDHLTPNGLVEEGQNLLSQGVAALSNLLGETKAS